MTQLLLLSLQHCQIQLDSHTDPTMAAQYMINLKEDSKLTSAILNNVTQFSTDPSKGAHTLMTAYDIQAISAAWLVAGIDFTFYYTPLLCSCYMYVHYLSKCALFQDNAPSNYIATGVYNHCLQNGNHRESGLAHVK